MDAAAASLATWKTGQAVFSLLATLHLTSYKYPPTCNPKDGEYFDYIVVGCGTAGSIIANRLTENENVNYPGLFPFTAETSYDYNFPTVNDNYTGQLLRDNSVRITAGKMLGGSSGLSHFLDVRGNPFDFSRWATAAGEDSWNYEGLLPYFIKSEKVTNETILDSPTGKFHGTNGNVEVNIVHSNNNVDIINAFKELGHKYNEDINSNETLGITEPFYFLANGKRSDMASEYITPIKQRKNLHIWKEATVTKINFDLFKNAVSVEVMDSKNKIKTINANKEILLAAGIIKTPQLLMLSGIGPRDQLQKYGIPVLSDLPVGKNLQDHVVALALHKLDPSIAIETPPPPTEFPTPYLLVNANLDPKKSIPDYQVINIFLPHDTGALNLLCGVVLKYENELCNQLYKANIGRNALLSVIYKHRPLSSGEVTLNSKDPLATPTIKMNYYSDKKDLEDMVEYVHKFREIVNTTVLLKKGAEFLDLDLKSCKGIDKDTDEYWKCYILSTSASIYHFIGTCALGTVLDSKLSVKGVNRLRVVDASAIPDIPSGDNMAALTAFVERAADIIKSYV
ncbi:unnamed protein product [Diatraea saccharalis]|uniref:Uncharacterized protein n=1 Tax=Diatraea saccharalis TaxID=40085 RepID=A0A9N9R5T0_9NEOP|nr:unnamed protein product [Diatraea saccharalis]